MHGAVLERVVEAAGDAYQDRALIDLGEFIVSEVEMMTDLFIYWRDLRRCRDALPRLTDLSFETLIAIGAAEHVNLIDVTAHDAAGFRIEVQSARSYAASRIDLRNRSLGEYYCPLHAAGLQRDYLGVKRAAAPRYHSLETRVGRRWRIYTRLILPLTEDGRSVERLLVTTRSIHCDPPVG